MDPLRLEIAVTSADGARAALAGGADRVELCTALELGGLTPSQGLTEEALAAGIRVHALVRCRPGGFVYDASEVRTMQREARSLVAAGVSGIVVGALNADGTLDRATTVRLIDAARSVSASVDVTFHRAIDHAADPAGLLRALPGLGVDRVLSSGGASTVREGLGLLRELASTAGPVEIMAGGGLALDVIRDAVEAGATSVHLSAKRRVGSDGSSGANLGSLDDGGSHLATDEETVRAARAALDTASAGRA